jgi:hypothetical protein
MSDKSFEIHAKVRLKLSGEKGEVTGLLTDAEVPPQYLVRYVDATGCQQDRWFAAGALEADPDPA